MSKVAAVDPCSDTKLFKYLLQLLLKLGKGIIGEICVIVEAVGAIKKVVEDIRIRLESETLTFWAFIVQLIRDARNVIRELTLLPDGMIVPHSTKALTSRLRMGIKTKRRTAMSDICPEMKNPLDWR